MKTFLQSSKALQMFIKTSQKFLEDTSILVKTFLQSSKAFRMLIETFQQFRENISNTYAYISNVYQDITTVSIYKINISKYSLSVFGDIHQTLRSKKQIREFKLVD